MGKKRSAATLDIHEVPKHKVNKLEVIVIYLLERLLALSHYLFSLDKRTSLIYFLASVVLASGLAAGAAAFASVGLAAGAGALASAGLTTGAGALAPAADLASAGLVVAGALFCALASSFFSGFADEAPHSLVLLQEVISLDERKRRKRSGKEGC
jgi:hypothetical protein